MSNAASMAVISRILDDLEHSYERGLSRSQIARQTVRLRVLIGDVAGVRVPEARPELHPSNREKWQ
jgi:hypothetical protein